MEANINELVGKVLTKIENENDEITFHCESGEIYKLWHESDCCESVTIDDINGDLEDLVGSPITLADEVSNKEFEDAWASKFTVSDGFGSVKKDSEGNYEPDSHTWTFYKFATVKGYVDIRWFGESNGYYSESVSFSKADKKGNFSCW